MMNNDMEFIIIYLLFKLAWTTILHSWFFILKLELNKKERRKVTPLLLFFPCLSSLTYSTSPASSSSFPLIPSIVL